MLYFLAFSAFLNLTLGVMVIISYLWNHKILKNDENENSGLYKVNDKCWGMGREDIILKKRVPIYKRLVDNVSDDNRPYFYEMVSIISIIVLIISIFASCQIKGILNAKVYEETFQTDTYELEPIGDSIKMEGYNPEQLLYVHEVEEAEEEKVYYYKSNGKINKIYAKNTVKSDEQNSGKPIIVEYTTYTKYEMKRGLAEFLWFLAPSYGKNYGNETISYKIIVPKETTNIQE